MTKITSSSNPNPTTALTTPEPEPAPEAKTAQAPTPKECAPQSPPQDTWETDARDDKPEGFFSKLGQKIDSALDTAQSTVKNTADSIQQKASEVLHDGIDSVQKRANDTVDNFQQNIENIQKNTNEAIDVLQTLDAPTVKDLIIQDIQSTAQSAVQTVKDVASAASQALGQQQEIKRQQNEAITKAITQAFEKAPEILEAAEQATRSLADNTQKAIEKYALPAIQDVYQEISTNTEAFAEKIQHYAKNPDDLHRAIFHLEGKAVSLASDLGVELAIVAADVVAKNDKVLRTAIDAVTSIDIPTPQGLLFNQVKKFFPEDSLAHELAHLAGRGATGIIREQLQSMTRAIGHDLVTAAVEISKDPETFRQSLDVTANVLDLKPGQEFKLGAGISADVYAELGGEVEAEFEMKASRDPENPNEIVIEVSKETAAKIGAGVSTLGEGVKVNAGLQSIHSTTLRFDTSDPEQVKDLDAFLKTQARGYSSSSSNKVLAKYVEEISFQGGTTAELDMPVLKLEANPNIKASFNPKDRSVELTASYALEGSASLKTPMPQIQLPARLSGSNITPAESEPEPHLKLLRDAVLGKNSAALAGGVKAKAEGKITYDPAIGVSVDGIKTVALELSATTFHNTNEVSAKLDIKLHNPAELARLLGTGVEDLIKDFQSQRLSIDDIEQHLIHTGAQLENFVEIEGKFEMRRSDGFALDSKILKAEARTYTNTDLQTFIKFPPETQTQPQINKDAAEANLRLLDRAFHA